MHNLIDEILDKLTPALKSRRKAREQLERYWSDKIALIWTNEDVHRAANEREIVLTEKEARQVLTNLHQHHNKQTGLQWADVIEVIQQTGLGRTITRRELNRFIHKDIITQKSSRRKTSTHTP